MSRMRCLVMGHRWQVIRENWVPAKNQDDHVSLLQFVRCSACQDTKATITHPHDCKSAYSSPGYGHRWVAAELEDEGLTVVGPDHA